MEDVTYDLNGLTDVQRTIYLIENAGNIFRRSCKAGFVQVMFEKHLELILDLGGVLCQEN